MCLTRRLHGAFRGIGATQIILYGTDTNRIIGACFVGNLVQMNMLSPTAIFGERIPHSGGSGRWAASPPPRPPPRHHLLHHARLHIHFCFRDPQVHHLHVDQHHHHASEQLMLVVRVLQWWPHRFVHKPMLVVVRQRLRKIGSFIWIYRHSCRLGFAAPTNTNPNANGCVSLEPSLRRFRPWPASATCCSRCL